MIEFQYTIKWGQETVWLVAVAIVAELGLVLGKGMPVDDWESWAISLGAGCGRIALAIVGTQIAKLLGRFSG